MLCELAVMCFFFSSRRRHTRCYRDWSSDVCSSDLNSIRDATVTGVQTCALPISTRLNSSHGSISYAVWSSDVCSRSEEHTSELPSRQHIACPLLAVNKNRY